MDKEFLKKGLFLVKGIYDNKVVYENTLEAIQRAIDKKLNLYLTIRETKDGKYVLYEDHDLSRLHNLKDKIEDITYEDLSYLSFYHIPTLAEVLELVNGKVNLIINPKLNVKNKEIFNILDAYQGMYALISPHYKIINFINKNREDIIVGEVVTKRKKFSLSNLTIKPDFKSYDMDFFDSIKLKKLKEDTLVLGYLVKTKAQYDAYKDIFDNLIVDNYLNLKIDAE